MTQPKSTAQPRWHLGLLQIVFLLFFLLFFGGGVYSAWNEQRQFSNYRPVEMTILKSRIGVDIRKMPGSPTSTTYAIYTPIIVYSYDVGGITYERDNVWPMSHPRADKDFASAVLARYHVGSTYTGYYDPARPNSSYLERSIDLQPYLVMLGAVVMFLLPVCTSGFQQPRNSLPT